MKAISKATAKRKAQPRVRTKMPAFKGRGVTEVISTCAMAMGHGGWRVRGGAPTHPC